MRPEDADSEIAHQRRYFRQRAVAEYFDKYAGGVFSKVNAELRRIGISDVTIAWGKSAAHVDLIKGHFQGNRVLAESRDMCSPFLLRQMRAYRPCVVVLNGSYQVDWFVNKRRMATVQKAFGLWHKPRIGTTGMRFDNGSIFVFSGFVGRRTRVDDYSLWRLAKDVARAVERTHGDPRWRRGRALTSARVSPSKGQSTVPRTRTAATPPTD